MKASFRHALLLAPLLAALALPAAAQTAPLLVPKDTGISSTTDLRAAAEGGNPHAQSELARHFEKGSGGLAKDLQQAAAWYEKAAAQGEMTALFNLGALHHNGDLGKADSARAIEYWKRVGPMNGKAALLVGDLYFQGAKVPKDETQASFWFHKAAELGEADGQLIVGNLYNNGVLVKKDERKAFDWYTLAAAQGQARAQMFLGHFYDEGNLVQLDRAKAYRLYLQSAEQGEPFAQVKVGVYHAQGWGGAEESLKKAEFWLAKAAAKGNSEGVRLLAIVRRQMQ